MALFDQDDWLVSFPEFFENGQPVYKGFGTYEKPQRLKFLMGLLGTMSIIYKGLHHFLPNNGAASLSEQEIANQIRSAVLPAWDHVLKGCSVAQILAGLFLVIGGKTTYTRFPPSAPLEFKEVCTAHRPAYHDVVQKVSTAPQLGFDKEAAERRKLLNAKNAIIRVSQGELGSQKAVETMKNMCKRYGLDINKLNDIEMTEEEQELYDMAGCLHHEYCMQGKMHGRIVKDLRR